MPLSCNDSGATLLFALLYAAHQWRRSIVDAEQDEGRSGLPSHELQHSCGLPGSFLLDSIPKERAC